MVCSCAPSGGRRDRGRGRLHGRSLRSLSDRIRARGRQRRRARRVRAVHDLRAHVRRVAAEAGPDADAAARPTEMAAPAWVLTTEEGKTHRFRDPTTLQKWIVERRVGRADRVRPPGAQLRAGSATWTSCGRSSIWSIRRIARRRPRAGRVRRSPRRRSGSAPRARGYASPDEDDDDVLMSGRRSRGGGQRGRGGYSGRLDSDIAAGLSDMGVDDSIGVVLPRAEVRRSTSLGGLVIAGLAVGAWFLRLEERRLEERRRARPPPAPVADAGAAAAAAPPRRRAARRRAARGRRPRRRRPPRRRRAAAARAPPPGRRRRPRTSPPSRCRRRGRPRARPPRPPRPPGAAAQLRAARRRRRSRARERQHRQGAEADRRGAQAAAERRRGGDQLRLPAARQAEAARRDRRVQARAQPRARLSAGAVRPRRGLPRGGQRRAGDRRVQAVSRGRRPAGSDAPAAHRQIRELESQPARPSHSATANVPAPGSRRRRCPSPAPPP